MKMFDKKADKNIIQDNTNQRPAGNTGKAEPCPCRTEPGKNNMTHQHKAGWETDEKGYDEGSYMRFKGNKSQVQNLLV